MLSDIIKVLLVATSLLFTSSSYSQSLFPYLKGDLYGFADSTGKVIVEPVYEQITHHGYTTFFSEMHDPKRRKYQDKDWPEELALGYTDGKWHLLDKHCNSILKEGTKGKIKVSSWSTTSPYLVITTDSITDGWGIWNANTGETEGLVYYYGKAGRDMSGNTIFKDSDDLNPFRGGCQELYASIKDSDCKKAFRKDGTVDLLSKYHQILKSNYKSEEKEGWKDLSYSDRQTLESAEIKRNCTGAESYGSIPYDPYANDRKKEKKKSKWSRLSLYERRQYLIDSINLKTGTSYDTVARFLITPFEFWSCGLLKKRNRIDIINSEGKVIYKTKAAAIPKSITSGKLFMVNSVFVKGAKERVIIQDDETISPADQYHDLHYTNSFVLAFLDAEEAYPLHLFDAKGKKVFDSDVYGLTRSNRALIKKPNGEYAIRGIFGKMETLDGVEFDLIELTGEKTKAPLQLKDKIPREYVEENGNPPFLDHDYLAGYRDTKYSKHKVLLDLFDTSNSRNRKRSKVQSPNFYSTNHPRGKRLVALVGNTVHLDTVVQKLVAVKADSKAIVAEIDGQVKEILLTNQKRSFFKQKHRGTEMYITSKGDSISLRSASGKVIQTTAANSRGAYLQMTPNQVMNDRHILHLNNEESVLLDDQGHTLHIIKKMNPNWIVTSAAHPEMHSPLDFQLIGKTFLKVYHPKPYLINLETMKVFRSD